MDHKGDNKNSPAETFVTEYWLLQPYGDQANHFKKMAMTYYCYITGRNTS